MIESYEPNSAADIAVSAPGDGKDVRSQVPQRQAQPQPSAKKKSDLGVRCLAGIVYFAVTAACVLLGNITTALYLSAVAGMCAFEFFRMMKADDKLVNEWLGVAAAVAFPIAVYFTHLFGIIFVVSAFVLVLVAWYVFWPKARIIDLCLTAFGAVYMGMPLSCLLAIRMDTGDQWGGIVLLAIIASVWLNDVGAYLVGRQFGKHKMAPLVSPKKTWEGFFGGLVFSVASWCLITLIPAIDISITQAVVFGLLCGAVGVLGDLTESRIKRNVGVKDSGKIMPGHGGMFDRTDSLLTVAIVVTSLLYLGGCIPNVAL